MSDLKINGVSIGPAQIAAVKDGVSVEQAMKTVKKDGLDEVFFRQDDQLFVASGDGLNLKGLKKGTIPVASLDGKDVKLEGVDDEANTVGQGIKKELKWAGAVAGIAAGSGAVLAGSAISAAKNMKSVPLVGQLMGAGGLVVAATVVAAGVVAGAGIATYGAIKGGSRHGTTEPLNSITQK